MATPDGPQRRALSSSGTSAESAAAAADPASERIELNNLFDRLLAVACLLLMGGVVATVLLQVGMRYVFNSPLAWSEEFARYQLVWLAFLGAALAYRLRMHIAVDAAAEMLKQRSLKSLESAISGLVHAVVLVVALVLVSAGYDLVGSTWSRTTPALGAPMGAVYLAVPVAGLIIIGSAVQSLVQNLRLRQGGIGRGD